MITKNYELGTIKIRIEIADGIAILTTNNFRVTRQMYDGAIKSNKNVKWDINSQAMIETYEGKSADEIAVMLDHDFKVAKEEQRKASIYARSRK